MKNSVDVWKLFEMNGLSIHSKNFQNETEVEILWTFLSFYLDAEKINFLFQSIEDHLAFTNESGVFKIFQEKFLKKGNSETGNKNLLIEENKKSEDIFKLKVNGVVNKIVLAISKSESLIATFPLRIFLEIFKNISNLKISSQQLNVTKIFYLKICNKI
jgi:hypothetical protein